MSGLLVMYSKVLKTGEWVRVSETEGAGLLAAKIRTSEGQEVSIPNSVLLGTSTADYAPLGYPNGMVVSCTMTIGYAARWRQALTKKLRGRCASASNQIDVASKLCGICREIQLHPREPSLGGGR
jgi:hypothetical protein